VASGLTHLSYAVSFKDKDFGQKSPFAFDAYDLWFGDDFNYILNSLLDDLLEDIETDISSVDSSNLSEADSAQISAQSSANAQARFDAGLDFRLDPSSSSMSRVSTGTDRDSSNDTT
jgi:hypothetical protein